MSSCLGQITNAVALSRNWPLGLNSGCLKSRFPTIMKHLDSEGSRCLVCGHPRPPFCDADKCMRHINTMSYFSLVWKDHMKPALHRFKKKKTDCFVNLLWPLSSRWALWETSSQTYILLGFDKDKLYSVREKEEKVLDYSLNKKSRGMWFFFLPSST